MKTIYLGGVIGYDITAEGVRAQLGGMKTEKLQVIVHSYGGNVFEAFEIYNLFKAYKGEIEFVIGGIAASAASYILMAGDKISAFKNSTFMAHKAWSFAVGDSEDFGREAKILKAVDNVLAEAYSLKFGKSKEDVLAEIEKEIWLIGWEELSNAGIIDDVIDNVREIEGGVPAEAQMDLENLAQHQETKENVKLRLLNIQSRMRKDGEHSKISTEKAVALLRQFDLPEASENIEQKEEGEMFLQDFLQKNPEAKAEYDKALVAAKAEGRQEASAGIEADRTRIAKIIKIADASVSAKVTDAIDSNMDPADFAIQQKEEELARQEASNGNPTPFGELLARQTPAEQTANAQLQYENDADEFEKKIRAALKKGKEA